MRTLVVLLLVLALTKGTDDIRDGVNKETELPTELPTEEEEEECDCEGEPGRSCCSSCRDDDPKCLFLRLGGQCTDPTVYRKCEFSCSDCSCGDNARDCAEQLKVKSCSDIWMRKHCKQSCGRCTCRDRSSSSYCHRVRAGNLCHRYGYRCERSCDQCRCEDTVADCQVRAGRGECVINMDFMMRHCKSSCNQCNGACVDNLSDCALWISQNPHACQANPSFMNVHCPKSCRICTPEEEPTEEGSDSDEEGECVDKEDTCVLAAHKGECLNPEVREKCPFSCRQCVCGDLDQRCEAWAEEGKCYTDRENMSVNCRQTCQFCGCQDKPEHVVRCLVLASEGKCTEDPQNLVDCPESCHVCECGDNSASCMTEALAGKCQSDPKFMLTHCAESCHQCNKCGDNPPFQGKICTTALQRGYCDTEPLFKIHCAKTCGVCTEDGGSSSEEEDPEPNPNPDPEPSPWGSDR